MKYEISNKSNKNHLLHIIENINLLFVFVKRDFQVRYKNMLLGNLWVILRPTLFTLIFLKVFSLVGFVSSIKYPYILFAFSGLSCWQFLQNSFLESSQKLVSHEALISKVYFPRLIVVLSSLIVNAFDLLILSLLNIGIAFYFNEFVFWKILFLLPLLFTFTLMVFPMSSLLAVLYVRFKDMRLILPFVVQVAFYLSPVVYVLNIESNFFSFIRFINPFSGFIEIYRWIFLKNYSFDFTVFFPFLIFSVLSFFIAQFVIDRYIKDIVEFK